MSSFTVQIEDNPVKSIQIETSIGNNPASLEVQTFDNNIIQIEDGLTFTPLIVSNILNATISQFLQAGSGISLASGVDSLTINSFTLPHVHNTNDIIGLVSAIQQNSTVKDVLASSGISVTSNSGIYSIALSNPNLQSSNILDFAQAVSGLLPITNVFAGSGISVTKSGTNYTVAATGEFGLTPEQVDDRVSSLLFAGSNITLNYNDNANTLTISTSGLQPSGNYANLIHTHTSSNITDFNSSVSGLLPITNILGGTNISVVPNGSQFTVSVSGQLGLTSEEVDDRVSELLIAGSGIVLNYNDNVNSLVILTSGLQPSGNYSIVGHNHSSNDITDFNSSVSGLINGIYAPLNNPSLTGIPTAPTANSGTNNTQIANTQFVRTEISNNLEQKANLSGAIFTGSISGPSGDFNILRQSGINVSVSGHAHSYTDITNFASGIDESVSTLLVAGNNINLNYDNINDTLTISATGLQPSGNYSVVGHTHAISDIISLQTTLDGKQASGNYAASSHTHTALNITDFNSSVSGLLPSVSGSGYATTSFANNAYTVSVTGLQPSGNYSTVGHTHTSSNITDFNSSVSGLLPVKDIAAGSGISVGAVSGIYTITANGVAAASASSLVTNCSNRTGSVIPKMTVVYINGGHGNLPTITPAQASNEANSSKSYGITQSQILDNNTGNVVVFGALIDVNTNQFGASEGSTLYLSPTVAGGITATKPSAPDHMVSVGKIVRNHNNQGIIEVVIQNGFELQELHNVAISGVNNGEFLQYNSGSGLWVPSSSGNFSTLFVNGTGVSLNGHTHTTSDITNFNTSVSGLLPVTNILGGSNINVSTSGTNYTIAVSGSLGLTTEEVDDRVSNLLVAGSGINLNYDDNANTLTINNTSISPDEIEEYVATVNFPASGNLNILYVETNTGQLYKWDGEVYYEAGPQGASTGFHGTQHESDSSDPVPLTEYNVPQFTANTNNLNHLNKDILYITADANNRELSGLLAPSFCCVKLLVNISSTNTIIIDNQSTNSDPANRFLNYTGADYYLLPGQSLSVLYSTEAMRWRIL